MSAVSPSPAIAGTAPAVGEPVPTVGEPVPTVAEPVPAAAGGYVHPSPSVGIVEAMRAERGGAPFDLTASYELCRRINAAHGRTYYLATRLLPRSSHVRMDGLGHCLHVQDPGRVTDAITDFLQERS